MSLDRSIGFALALLACLAPRPSGQAVRVTQELARGNLYKGTAALTPDGRHVVFAGRYYASGVNVNQLYGAPSDGSAEATVLYDESGFPDERREFDPGTVTFLRLTSDSRRALFTVDERGAIYGVRVDGSAPYQWLAGADTDVPFLVSPDGTRAVFTRHEYVNANTIAPSLYSVATDGSQAAVRIVPGQPGRSLFDIAIDAGSQRVVFTAGDEAGAMPRKLFSVRIDGVEPPVNLSPFLHRRFLLSADNPQPVDASVSAFEISPDGAHVLLLVQNSGRNGSYTELYTVPTDGAEPARLLASGDVRLATFAPQSERVVYRAAPLDGGPATLFAQGLDGGAPVPLHQAADAVERLVVLAHAVLFVDEVAGSGERLFLVPLAGDLAACAQSARLPVGRTVREFHVSPDGARLVYSADAETAGVFTLFAVELGAHAGPAAGSSGVPVLLGGPADVERFVFLADSAAVLAHVAGLEGLALERVPLDGGPARRLSGAEGVSDLFLDAAGTVAAYRGAREHDTRPHVYGVALGVALNQDTPPVQLDAFGPVLGGIMEYEMHPDRGEAIYSAGDPDFAFPEPYVVPLDLSSPPRRLAGLVQGSEYLLDHRVERQSERLVYEVQPPTAGFQRDLFSAPLDARTPRMRLGQNVLEYGLASGRALFVTRTGSQADLHSVPADGSDEGVLLNGPGLTPLIDGRDYDFTASPDGKRVLFLANRELFSSPADGSAPAVRLNPTPVSGGHVQVASFRFTPDGTHVVFLGDLTLKNAVGLWVAPVDGATPALELWSPPAGREVTRFAMTPDSSRAVFAADLETSGRHRLYVVPLDGSAAPVALPRASDDSEVRELRLTPDGVRVVFSGLRIAVVPVDGSSAVVLLNPALPGRFLSFEVSNEWCVYEADHELAERFDLFAVPLDAGAPPRRVNEAVVDDRRSQPFAIVGDEVLFLNPVAPGPHPYRIALYRAPLSGARPPQSLNPPGTFASFGSNTAPFLVSHDGTRVLFAAGSDSQALYVAELGTGTVATPLVLHSGPAARPDGRD